tara:strand:+ start:1427 stop:1537 length:111 start_codon:yes stop_codon:yes gene_type:complete
MSNDKRSNDSPAAAILSTLIVFGWLAFALWGDLLCA